jgi:hypothetical protein
MARIRTPNGLTPYNMQGGAPYNGGPIRHFRHFTNTDRAFGVGAIVQIVNGSALPVNASPTTSTAGIVGVCVGVSFVDPVLKQPLFGQYLPPNAVTLGYTDIRIMVNDDPNQLYLVNVDTVPGVFTNGPAAAIGRNAAVAGFTVNAVTGRAITVLDTGAAWASVGTGNTLAMRIVDVVEDSLKEPWPELVVKFNAGVHSYTAPLGS